MAHSEYSFVAIPLGLPKLFTGLNGEGHLEFSVSIVASLDVQGAYSELELCQVVDANPLWNPDQRGLWKAQVERLLPSATSITVELTPTPGSEIDAYRERMKVYLIGKRAALAGVGRRAGVKSPDLDRRFDQMTRFDFVDSQNTYDASIPERDFVAYGISTGFASNIPGVMLDNRVDLGKVSPRLLRLTNAMVMQESVRQIFEPKGGDERYRLQDLLSRQLGGSGSLQVLAGQGGSVREDLQRHEDRIDGYRTRPVHLRNDPSVKEEELRDLLNGREPNTLLRIAARDAVLSIKLGLVTRWTVVLRDPDGAFARSRCEFTLEVQRFSGSSEADVTFATKPTVFRIDDQVCPATKNPKVAATGALAWLNGRANGNDYRALQVNSDNEIMKAWGLQSTNTLRTHRKAREASANIREPGPPDEALSINEQNALIRDGRVMGNAAPIADQPPEMLPGEIAGVSQPECKGVTFSASIEDLADAGEPYGAKWREQEGKYYLEDLWIGYRIDLAEAMPDDEKARFISLNAEQVEVGVTGTDLRFTHESESYFDREQLCMDRPTAAEITTWTGIAPWQRYPLSGCAKHELPGTDAAGHCDYEHSEDLNPTAEIITRQIVPPRNRKLLRLLYGKSYRYRIRNVFTGATSLELEEANRLLGVRSTLWKRHTQSFDFRRVQAFSPGEIANPAARTGENPKSTDTEQTLYLLGEKDRKVVYLLPRALETTELRFQGIIGKSVNEVERFRDVAETRNVRRLLFAGDGKLRHSKYFLDPEVSAVILRAYVTSRNEQSSDSPPTDETINDIECETIDPWRIAAERLRYGNPGQWEQFRPIQLKFHGSGSGRTQADTKLHSGGGDTFTLSVPPGEHVEISVLPDVSPQQIASSFFYGNAKRYASRRTGEFFSKVFRHAPMPALPIVAERSLRIVHATPKPLKPPVLAFDHRYLQRQTDSMNDAMGVFRMPRATQSHEGYIVGTVEVHAPTTGEICFEAHWKVIEDSLSRPQYFMADGSYRSEVRSVFYGDRPQLQPTEALRLALDPASSNPAEVAQRLARLVEQQCLENSVRLGEPPPPPSLPLTAGQMAVKPTHLGNRIDFKNGGRRIATIVAVASARYRHLFPNQDGELRSNPVHVDAPNRTSPPVVQLSHVLPTFAADAPLSPDAGGSTGRVGLRIYVKRQWFVTGIGERCAIGCLFRDADDPKAYALAKKYATHWGEDVFERPQLSETLRLPRAEDFGTAPLDDGKDLDENLYPRFDPRERSLVFYRDDVLHPLESDPNEFVPDPADAPGAAATPVKKVWALSLASYALRYDANQQLHYFDVFVRGGFFGWLKLALYRHQPSSDPGFEISATPAHAYVAILHDDVVVQHDEGAWWVMRIGPVFDRTVSFAAQEAREEGAGIFISGTLRYAFSEQTIEGSRYFVLRIDKVMQGKLLVYKLRAGVRQWAFRA